MSILSMQKMFQLVNILSSLFHIPWKGPINMSHSENELMEEIIVVHLEK